MSELKYKVGDKVQIKDIGWYNENKNEDGDVELSTTTFIPEMSKYCGTIVTIKDVFYNIDDNALYQMEGGITWGWTDEMIECLVERNGKTYPYKIGDRVVLKGNNRCATITDLKYNSWGNLSYYVKIDNDKDISIDYPTDLLLPYDNKIKGFLEEETIPIPKFKVGDKITNGKVTLTILTLSLDRYVVKDSFGKCGTLYFNSQDEWKIVGEEMKSEDELLDEYEELTDRAFKGGYEKCKSDIELNGFQLPDGYIFKDGNGNVINTNKIVLEKKNQYPKTHKECCEILNYKPDFYDADKILIYGFMSDELKSLQKLLVCRNAYWKLYGDEMGLDKPWEPTNETVYCISRSDNVIKSSYRGGKSNTLEFPTPEMRDAFYENFKSDIEQCKELL